MSVSLIATIVSVHRRSDFIFFFNLLGGKNLLAKRNSVHGGVRTHCFGGTHAAGHASIEAISKGGRA